MESLPPSQLPDDPIGDIHPPHSQDGLAPPLPASPSNGDGHSGDNDGDQSRASTMYDPVSNSYRPKVIKPNKIYVGNLPGNTREEDLEGCFGEMGKILSVELKVGYGFVEFESRDQAEKAVQKYDGGLFLGNKIRCELSHGGGKTAKFAGEPGACFKCRLPGHWARECPNDPVDPSWKDYHRDSKPGFRRHHDGPGRHHPPPPPAEDMNQYPARSAGGFREDARGEPPARLPPRDFRSDHAMPPLARDMRDYRSPRDSRPLSPPPNARGYPPRDYDDYRGAPRGPPPPAPPPLSTGPYDARMPPYDSRSSAYEARAPPYASEYDRAPPARDYGPSSAPAISSGGYDRAAPYGAPPFANGRSRSPATGFDSRRDYGPPSAAAPYDPYRGRGPAGPGGPPVPPRYDPYSRRRSMSPPPRSASSTYYESGPPSSSAGGFGGGPYRPPQDYPPGNGYYDGPPSGTSGYRGPRDDREGHDRRYSDGRMNGGGYDRR